MGLLHSIEGTDREKLKKKKSELQKEQVKLATHAGNFPKCDEDTEEAKAAYTAGITSNYQFFLHIFPPSFSIYIFPPSHHQHFSTSFKKIFFSHIFLPFSHFPNVTFHLSFKFPEVIFIFSPNLTSSLHLFLSLTFLVSLLFSIYLHFRFLDLKTWSKRREELATNVENLKKEIADLEKVRHNMDMKLDPEGNPQCIHFSHPFSNP